MMKSRGMGSIMPSKMPGKKIIHRTDNPNDVEMYADGGSTDKWIQGAIKQPGALHEDLGVPQGETIPPAKLEAAVKKPGKIGQRARLAKTLKGLK